MTGALGGRETDACVVVHQNCAHDRLQIAAHALAVVVKNGDDAIDVTGAGIARHQSLNQLPANKWSDVRMVEDRVEGRLQILGGALVRRNDEAVQNVFRIGLMSSRDVDHWIAPILRKTGAKHRVAYPRLRNS